MNHHRSEPSRSRIRITRHRSKATVSTPRQAQSAPVFAQNAPTSKTIFQSASGFGTAPSGRHSRRPLGCFAVRRNVLSHRPRRVTAGSEAGSSRILRSDATSASKRTSLSAAAVRAFSQATKTRAAYPSHFNARWSGPAFDVMIVPRGRIRRVQRTTCPAQPSQIIASPLGETAPVVRAAINPVQQPACRWAVEETPVPVRPRKP